MFDWTAATDALHRISRNQIARFLAGPDKDDLYGIGFFYDAEEGIVYLVANTEQYYQSSLLDFENQFGPTDAEVYRWDSGNWKYPGGLFPSSSPEQLEFENAWKEYQWPLSQLRREDKQVLLEEMCLKVLEDLIREGVFSTAPRVQGGTILGPYERGKIVLEKKKKLDHLFGRVAK
jgi:hypothetical protein